MALVDSIVVFLVGLLIGGLSIYIGARFITDSKDYMHAIITAVIGAVVLAILGWFITGIPLIGPLITLLVWIAVINWRYPGGWIDATLIGIIAWLSVMVILYILTTLGVTDPSAVGVPTNAINA